MQEKVVETTPIDTAQKKPVADSDLLCQPIRETDGVKGPEPTRYGDWEKNGRCIDF
jgi:hypothetical protein